MGSSNGKYPIYFNLNRNMLSGGDAWSDCRRLKNWERAAGWSNWELTFPSEGREISSRWASLRPERSGGRLFHVSPYVNTPSHTCLPMLSRVSFQFVLPRIGAPLLSSEKLNLPILYHLTPPHGIFLVWIVESKVNRQLIPLSGPTKADPAHSWDYRGKYKEREKNKVNAPSLKQASI